MKKSVPMIVGLLLGMTQMSQACGPRRARRAACAPTVHACAPAAYRPTAYTYAYVPAAYPQPAYVASASLPPQAAGMVPAYTYEPSLENRGAYYYTYDESGKLIVAQWMDWLFRGGKEAGMPRPPLPVIGLLRN